MMAVEDDLTRVRRAVNPEAHWQHRAERAEAELAALRARVAELADRGFIRSADLRSALTISALAGDER